MWGCSLQVEVLTPRTLGGSGSGHLVKQDLLWVRQDCRGGRRWPAWRPGLGCFTGFGRSLGNPGAGDANGIQTERHLWVTGGVDLSGSR